MVNKIEEFLNEKFGTVRAIKEGEVILFVAKDLADILKYKLTTDMTRDLEDYEKGMRPVHTLGGVQELTVVTEGGLYNVVMSITKRNKERYEIAREFKFWISNEVLPTLRQTGGYVEREREDEFVNNYLGDLSEETKIIIIKELKDKNEKLQVKANKWDKFLDTESTYTFTEVAKLVSTYAKEDGKHEFHITNHQLTKHLRNSGILNKTKSGTSFSNLPNKDYEKYFDVVSRPIKNKSFNTIQTRVKPTGVEFIYGELIENYVH